jgi:hypothetical protein
MCLSANTFQEEEEEEEEEVLRRQFKQLEQN